MRDGRTDPYLVGGFAGLAVVAVGSIAPWATSPLSSAGGLNGDGKWTILLAALGTWLLYSRGAERGLWRAGWVCVVIAAVGVYDAIHIHRVVARVTIAGTQIDHVGWGVYAVITGALFTLVVLVRAQPGGAPSEEEDALQAPGQGQRQSYLALILQLCDRYKWSHDFWRRMGVREFDAVVGEASRQASRATDPDSWEGYEQDPFWQGAHR